MPLGGLIMMAKPPPAVRSAMEAAVDHAGLSDRLVSALFAPERWHQLLSGIHEDTPRTLETLIGVGNAIVADPVLMRFDRISSSGGELCSFLTHGEPLVGAERDEGPRSRPAVQKPSAGHDFLPGANGSTLDPD